MGREIENYLLERFSRGIERSKRVRLRVELEDLKTMIKEKLDASPLPSLTLRENLYYLNNVLTECQRASSKPLFLSPSLTKIKDNLTRMKGELSDQHNLTSGNGNGNGSSIQNDPRSFSDNGGYKPIDPVIKVKGFDSEVLSLLKLLLRQDRPSKFNVVGVTGKAGAGKSTLCQFLLTRDEVKRHFVPRIWVCLSAKDSGREGTEIAFVKRMLGSLGVGQVIVNSIFQKDGLSGLIRALHAELMGKKYLIVLDDAREPGDWYEQLDSALPPDSKWEKRLAYGLPKGSGGTVVVNSRDEKLLKKTVGEESIHHLLPRSDPESCWNIFKDAVQQQFSTSSEVDLKKEVTQKCGGLPLAAKMMGEIMNSQIEPGTNVTIQAQQKTSSGPVEDVPNPSSASQPNPDIASPPV